MGFDKMRCSADLWAYQSWSLIGRIESAYFRCSFCSCSITAGCLCICILETRAIYSTFCVHDTWKRDLKLIQMNFGSIICNDSNADHLQACRFLLARYVYMFVMFVDLLRISYTEYGPVDCWSAVDPQHIWNIRHAITSGPAIDPQTNM